MDRVIPVTTSRVFRPCLSMKNNAVTTAVTVTAANSTGGKPALIATFMGPTWDPSGADRAQVGPILASWTLLSWWVTSVASCLEYCLSVQQHSINSSKLLHGKNTNAQEQRSHDIKPEKMTPRNLLGLQFDGVPYFNKLLLQNLQFLSQL